MTRFHLMKLYYYWDWCYWIILIAYLDLHYLYLDRDGALMNDSTYHRVNYFYFYFFQSYLVNLILFTIWIHFFILSKIDLMSNLKRISIFVQCDYLRMILNLKLHFHLKFIWIVFHFFYQMLDLPIN